MVGKAFVTAHDETGAKMFDVPIMSVGPGSHITCGEAPVDARSVAFFVLHLSGKRVLVEPSVGQPDGFVQHDSHKEN